MSGDLGHGRSAVVPWWQRPSRGIVWVALPAVSLGLLAPFTFTYAAAKRRSVITVAAAVCFVALSVVIWTAPEESRLFDIALFTNLFGSICAALALRPHVFRITEQTATAPAPEPHGWPGPAHHTVPGPPPAQMSGPMPSGEADPEATNMHMRQQAEQGRARRAEARALAAQNPTGAVELGIGRPDRQTGYDDGGLIDLNRAPGGVLSQLPGLDPRHVDALLHSRGEIGPFVSLADAMIRADIPPHLEDEVAEYAIVF